MPVNKKHYNIKLKNKNKKYRLKMINKKLIGKARYGELMALSDSFFTFFQFLNANFSIISIYLYMSYYTNILKSILI
jgi:hypothetical protein